MEAKNPLTASEIGTLWLTYQEKTLILRVLEYFMEKANDQEAKNIMGGLWQELHHYIKKCTRIFDEEHIAIPVGFTNQDVNINAPKLWDNGFDINFLRTLKEVSLGMYTLNMNMAYREDVMSMYENLTVVSQKVYKLCTHYLVERGILPLPPIVTPPKTNEFIESKKYLQGLNPFAKLRPLNDIEIGYLHHGIESNNIGIKLITGFAQVAENKEVKQYFLKGKQLAEKQVKMFEEILQESNVSFSATSGGTITSSTIAPFSEKLMMMCIFFLNGFSIVGQSFGSMFSLRRDLALKNTLITKDVFTFNDEGVKIMIKNGWLEEPPQMENHEALINEK